MMMMMIIIIIIDNEHWNDHEPKSVETSYEGRVTILWNQHVQTNRTIP